MTVSLMGIEIDNYTFDEAVKQGQELISGNTVTQVVTINPEMYTQAEKDEQFKNIIKEAELVIPDGVGIKIALRLKGYNTERVPGIDFAKKLLEFCAKNNYPVAIVGAKEEVISAAIFNLKKEIEGLNIVYHHNGYYDDENLIFNEIKNSGAKLVLAALGSPKQEFFIYKAKQILSSCLMVGIGGSLDVWSGFVKRAPKIYRALGLEWLYRTLCQPERFKRIFPTIPLFLIKSIMYKKD